MAVLEASPLYQDLKNSIVEQERRATVETLMQLRFGTIDPELEAIVPKLITLPVEEFSPLILQRSREELLDRFGNN